MKNRFNSFVSMFLVICMVISNIPVYAIAESASKLGTSTSTETNLTTSKQEFNAASSSKVLDYVDKAEFESHKFVGRVLEDEELNSYVFQNEDGSRTAYFFSENVKYVDKDGIVQEKDISLTATRSGYSTTKNDVTASFSGSPSEGISIGYDKYSVTLKPIFTTRGVTASQKNNSVEYVGLFDSNTTLKYTPLLSGIKEDIVLTKYTGVNEYSFTLTTNGLGVYESSAGFYLAESTKTKAIFYLGDVIAYDANLVPYEGTLTVETVKENQEYILTISVDEAFLTDKKTVYPVTIDPTITISDSESGANSIQDAPIFSARPSSNHGTYEYDRVGTPSAEFGVGRTVVRLYGLINSSTYINTSITDIVSVKFYAKEATGSATQYINLYPLQNTGWTESGVTWNNIGVYYNTTSNDYGASMAYAQLTEFDITGLVLAWKSGTYSANAGFIMMSSNESANKCFVSCEHSDASRHPYVVMKYGKSFDFDNASNLQVSERKEVKIAQRKDTECFKFIPSETGFYTFESMNITKGKPMIWIFNGLRQEIVAFECPFLGDIEFTYHFVAGYTYYLAVGYKEIENPGFTENFIVRINQGGNTDSLEPERIDFSSKSSSYNLSLESHVYKFTAPTTGKYLFISNNTFTPYSWLYDSGLNYLTEDGSSVSNTGFILSYTLEEDETYYIVAGQYSDESGTTSFRCLKEVTSFSDTVYLRNFQSQLYMEAESITELDWVSQGKMDELTTEKWQISKTSSGYFSVRSNYGANKYLGVASLLTGTNNIRLYSNASDNTLWKIYEDAYHCLVFVPKGNETLALCSFGYTNSRLQLDKIGSINTSEKCIWNDEKYVLFANPYYDIAFDVRYGDGETLVNEVMFQASKTYSTVLGVALITSSPISIESTADKCKIERDLPITINTISIKSLAICPSNPSIGEHCDNCDTNTNCTSLEKSFYDFASEHHGNYRRVTILFSGNKFYDDTGKAIDRSYQEPIYHAINIIDIEDSCNDFKAKMNYTLIHEIAHEFKILDHYHGLDSSCENPETCDKCNNISGQEEWCIMGSEGVEFNEETPSALIEEYFCPNCLSTILEHLEDHH